MNIIILTAIICGVSLATAAAPNFPEPSALPDHPAIPDPLVMFDGTPVTTATQWADQRKPELKELFQHYMYGMFPPPVTVQGQTTYTNANLFDGKATLKLVTLTLDAPQAPEIHLLIVVPNHRSAPAPAFVGMNFSGNHSLVTDTNVPIESSVPKVGPRGSQIHTWELERVVDRGYAVATYFCGDVEPDKTNAAGGVRETVHPATAADDWGTIAAWAWGLQRVMDYLTRDPDIDSKRIALVGHSRLGKAAILAGAFDDRAAMIIPLQAGCGGTAPSRGTVGESVKQINARFPHWFCGNFHQFNNDPARLPFDQNCLIAMCAPRPVLLGGARGDTWSNPYGAFEMLKAATPVYRLLGVNGMTVDNPPATNVLVGDNLAFFIRPGNHSMSSIDWEFFLAYADKHLAPR